jgi:acylphosphatase
MNDTDGREAPDAGTGAAEGPARRQRLEAVVRGSVQGVGFRYFVLREASTLGLVGRVSNEPDGSVSCIVEGPEPDVLRLLGALRDGPRAARVSRVEERWGRPTGEFTDFRIASGWHSGD